jgi:hypothetical protein
MANATRNSSLFRKRVRNVSCECRPRSSNHRYNAAQHRRILLAVFPLRSALFD